VAEGRGAAGVRVGARPFVYSVANVRAQVGPLAAQHKTLDETRKMVDFSRQRWMFVGDDRWLALWFDRYRAQPFVEMAWKEAMGIAITQGAG
jgi:hypothetical protein